MSITMKKKTKPVNNVHKRDKSFPEDTALRQKSLLFPIVGIGASAGGLEALEQFLGHVPENSGVAFVIVQHLDPTHKGIMHELLQRTTRMEVFQVSDRMRVP
jgi:two-component system CheB/CheR fusion protein